MIPLRDSAAARRLMPINSLLIAANIAVFIHEVSLGAHLGAFVSEFAMVPAAVAAWLGAISAPARAAGHAGSLWAPATLVSSMFLHAGWWHVGGNMLYLFIFGAAVESRLGWRRYLAFYLASGIVAGLAMVAMAPASRVPVIGASGAIAGVLGAYFIMYPRGRILTVIPLVLIPVIEIPAVAFLLLWFAVQLYAGVTEGGPAALAGGVAWWAHVGGFLFGMALGPLIARAAPRRRCAR
jgi:rhomboid family protein